MAVGILSAVEGMSDFIIGLFTTPNDMAEKIRNFYGRTDSKQNSYGATRRDDAPKQAATLRSPKIAKTDAHLSDSLASGSSSGTSASAASSSSRLPPKLSSLLRRAELKEREYKRKRLVVDYPSSISSYRHWRIFAWQRNAFDSLLSSRRPDLHLFSFETAFGETNARGGESRRRFLVTSYREFWHYYRQLNEDKRHFYEIIPEKAVCKLYFDLEYDKRSNPRKNPSAVMSTFYHSLCRFLWVELGVRVERKDFLDLDSSTSIKFSRHVIMASKGKFVLESNLHAGEMVGRFVAAVEKERVRWRRRKSREENHGDGEGEEESDEGKKEVEKDEESKETGEREKERKTIPGSKTRTEVDKPMTRVEMREHVDEPAIETRVGAEIPVSPQLHLPDNILADLDQLFCAVEEPREKRGTSRNEIDANANGNVDCREIRAGEKENERVTSDVEEGARKERSIVDRGVYTKNRAFRLFLSSKAAKKQPLALAEDNLFRAELEKDEDEGGGEERGNYRIEGRSPGDDALRRYFTSSLICNVDYEDEPKIVSYDRFSRTRRSSRSTASSTDEDFFPSPDSSAASFATAASPPSSPYPEIDAYVLDRVIRDSDRRGGIRRSAFFSDRKLLIYDVKDYRFCRRVGRHHRGNNIQILVDVVRSTWHQRCLDPDCRGFRSNEFPIPAAVFGKGTATTSSPWAAGAFDADAVDDELDDDTLFSEVVKMETIENGVGGGGERRDAGGCGDGDDLNDVGGERDGGGHVCDIDNNSVGGRVELYPLRPMVKDDHSLSDNFSSNEETLCAIADGLDTLGSNHVASEEYDKRQSQLRPSQRHSSLNVFLHADDFSDEEEFLQATSNFGT